MITVFNSELVWKSVSQSVSGGSIEVGERAVEIKGGINTLLLSSSSSPGDLPFDRHRLLAVVRPRGVLASPKKKARTAETNRIKGTS